MMMDCNNPMMHRPAPAPKRSFRNALLATALGVTLAVPALAPFALAQDPQGGQNLTQQIQAQTQTKDLLPSLSPVIQKVMPAVVNISVTSKGGDMQNSDEDATPGAFPGQDDNGPSQGFPQSPFDEMLRRFFNQGPNGQGPNGQQAPQVGRRVALGSGFIIDPQGYVVTNNHVVGDNAGTITVIFQDNSKHPAKLIGRDAKTDLALLKIDTKSPLPYVTWGDSDTAKVGDWIIAVGNPFGLGGTVTTGIVSARGRDIHSGPFDDFLQLDAPINRGNSGGPTFNQQGEVIGINTAIYSPNGGSVGIGFAIPSDMAKTVVAQLREHGKVDRGWLGVQIQEMTPEISSSLGLKNDHGALVADVNPGSPAAKAGVKQGDVILKYNGRDIDHLHDLPRLVAETSAGSTVPMTVWRNGHDEQLQAAVGQMPNSEQVASNDPGNDQGQQQATPERSSALGLQLGRLDDRARQQLGLKKEVKGVVVMQVAQDSPAADLGIQAGDVIVAINQQPVVNPGEAAQKMKQAQQSGDKQVLLLLNRHGVNQYIGMSVG
jgi:serine protease Do